MANETDMTKKTKGLGFFDVKICLKTTHWFRYEAAAK